MNASNIGIVNEMDDMRNFLLPDRISLTLEELLKMLAMEGILIPAANITANETEASNINDNTSFVNNTFNVALNNSIPTTKLCGAPGFCRDTYAEECENITLGSCSQCSTSGITLLLIFSSILALLVIFCNIAVFFLTPRASDSRKANNDLVKKSLAIADILTGLQIFAVAIPNVSRTLSSTSRELDMLQLSYRGTTAATIGGIFFVFTFTSSLYHLVYFSQQRLYALVSPINYKLQSKKAIYIGLAITWLTAAVAATVPAWFPEQFVYTYFHTTFFFYPALLNTTDIVSGAVTLAVFTVFPYLLMLSIIIATAVLLKRAMSRQSKLMSVDESKQQSSIFVTFGIMTLGFTLTLLPIIIVVALFYADVLNCDNLGTPYLICFYLSMANSLVNVVVYSFRDQMFRKRVKTWLSSCACSSAGKLSSTLSKPTGKTGLMKSKGSGDKRTPRISSSDGITGSGTTKSSSDRNGSSSTVLPMSPR